MVDLWKSYTRVRESSPSGLSVAMVHSASSGEAKTTTRGVVITHVKGRLWVRDDQQVLDVTLQERVNRFTTLRK